MLTVPRRSRLGIGLHGVGKGGSLVWSNWWKEQAMQSRATHQHPVLATVAK